MFTPRQGLCGGLPRERFSPSLQSSLLTQHPPMTPRSDCGRSHSEVRWKVPANRSHLTTRPASSRPQQKQSPFELAPANQATIDHPARRIRFANQRACILPAALVDGPAQTRFLECSRPAVPCPVGDSGHAFGLADEHGRIAGAFAAVPLQSSTLLLPGLGHHDG